MQPKVSIVIPCYNKDAYISAMFDSIIAQKWDNVELILVNNGSTDRTREIIAEYVPKFYKRGFEVVVVDQENKGLPAAVHEGLKRITGEYVCQVDADDELDPEYVSTMAGWLTENPEYQWTVCDLLYVYDSDKEVYRDSLKLEYPRELLLTDYAGSFLLFHVFNTVHEYMVRTDYVKLSRLVENYYSDWYRLNEPYRTQEPQWVLPLAVLGGKLKHISRALYKYMQNEDMLSARKTPADYEKYNEQYYAAVRKTIERLNVDGSVKKRYFALAEINYCRQVMNIYRTSPDIVHDFFSKLINAYEAIGFNFNGAANEEVFGSEWCVCAANYIADKLIGVVPKTINNKEKGGRIIAYAAFGKAAKAVKKMLLGSDIRPDVFWDKGALDGDVENSIPIVKPNFNSLAPNDTILLLLKDQEIIAEVKKQINSVSERADIWNYNDVQNCLVEYYLDGKNAYL